MENANDPVPVSEQIEELRMLQTVIARMANNSFLIKGWTLTLVVAIMLVKDIGSIQVFLAGLPAVMFWWLDAYYLRQETLFRKRHAAIALAPPGKADRFSMETKTWNNDVGSHVSVMFTPTLIGFYLVVLVILTILHAVQN